MNINLIERLKVSLLDECKKQGIECVVLVSDDVLQSCEFAPSGMTFTSPGIRYCIAELERYALGHGTLSPETSFAPAVEPSTDGTQPR